MVVNVEAFLELLNIFIRAQLTAATITMEKDLKSRFGVVFSSVHWVSMDFGL
jgi:hypothetical protein